MAVMGNGKYTLYWWSHFDTGIILGIVLSLGFLGLIHSHLSHSLLFHGQRTPQRSSTQSKICSSPLNSTPVEVIEFWLIGNESRTWRCLYIIFQQETGIVQSGISLSHSQVRGRWFLWNKSLNCLSAPAPAVAIGMSGKWPTFRDSTSFDTGSGTCDGDVDSSVGLYVIETMPVVVL